MLILDIETVPLPGRVTSIDEKYLPSLPKNLKDPKKIEAAEDALIGRTNKAKACDPHFGKIVAIGLIDLKDEDKEHCKVSDNETELLEWFWKTVKYSNSGFSTVGFNSLDFDLPYLFFRSWYNRIEMNERFELRKYSYIPHVDLMQVLSNWDRTRHKSLEFYAEAFGLPTQKFGDSSLILDYYDNRDWGKIEEHLMQDCRATKELYDVFKEFLPTRDPNKLDMARSPY